VSCCGSVSGLKISVCPNGQYCNSGSKTCIPQHKTGACSDPSECGDPNGVLGAPLLTYYACIGSQCQFSKALPSGAACVNDTDCANFDCNGGTCFGTAPGGTCSVSAECYYGDYCQSGSCTAVIASGASCAAAVSSDEVDNACAYGSSCSNNLCTPWFTVAVGGDCIADIDLCKTSLACVAGVCTATSISAPVSCTADSDCTLPSFIPGCQCNPSSGADVCVPVLPTFCASQKQAALSCAVSNNCGAISYSCAQTCAAPLNCYLNCLWNSADAFGLCGAAPSCGTNTGKATTGDAVVIRVSAWMIIAVVLAFLCL